MSRPTWTPAGSGDNFTQLTRRERRRIEQRRRIKQAAIGLFIERGYAEVTVESITTAADVAKGTFFNYFPTKADVLIAFWEEMLGEVLAYGESLPAASPLVSFRRFFRHFARLVEDNTAMFDLLVRQVAFQPALRDVEGDASARTRRIYRRFLSEGESDHGVQVDFLSEIIRDLWVGSLRQWVFSDHSFSLARRMDRKLQFVLSVLDP
ncbi:MAG: TetR/AcrR family transcriptional regulator [Planctomycetota bacterium]|jgi:AcrR family transcriptional regulator